RCAPERRQAERGPLSMPPKHPDKPSGKMLQNIVFFLFLVTIPRQSRGLSIVSRSKRLRGR
ncbi:hypothetical protein JZU46_05165, partial [bacterium]|nr:hypothetical protein [bacterium]